MPEQTGKFEALPMGEQPAQMEFHYGMPFMRGTQGSLEPLNDILTKRKEQAFIEGEFDLAMVLDDFQNRPNPQQYMDTMMQYMRSPADQSLLSSIARGYQALPPGVAGEINRVGPVPEAERKAWERYEAAATGAPAWEEVAEQLKASDEQRKRQAQEAIDAQKLEQQNMVDALRAEHQQSLAAIKEESKTNLEKIREHIAQTIAAGKSDADERVSKLQSVIDKLQNVGASSTDDGSDVWPRTVMIDGKSMTFQDRESYNKYLSGAGDGGIPGGEKYSGIEFDSVGRPLSGPAGTDLRAIYLEKEGVEVSGRIAKGEYGYDINGDLIQYIAQPGPSTLGRGDRVRYNVIARAPWNVGNDWNVKPLPKFDASMGTGRTETHKVSGQPPQEPLWFTQARKPTPEEKVSAFEEKYGIPPQSVHGLTPAPTIGPSVTPGGYSSPTEAKISVGDEYEDYNRLTRGAGPPSVATFSPISSLAPGAAMVRDDEMMQTIQNRYGGGMRPRIKKPVVTPPDTRNPQIDFARGGTTFNDTLALVGEEGPEMVKLPAGATVMPADVTDAIRRGKRPVPMVEGGVVFGGYGQEAAAPTRFSDIYRTGTEEAGPFYTTQAGM